MILDAFKTRGDLDGVLLGYTCIIMIEQKKHL